MNKKLLSLLATVPLAVMAMQGQTQTQTFNFTGGMQTFTVPCGVDTLFTQAWGAQGGSGAAGNSSAGATAGGPGANGGYAEGFLLVNPGDVINIFVGGQGGTPTAGFNGGGTGGSTNAGGGGGASDIRVGGTAEANRVLTAGGGGGGGRGGCESTAAINGGAGGNGGGANGGNGIDAPTSGGAAGGGFGGLTSGTGGAAGIGCGGFLGQPGATATTGTGGNGGAGQACCCFSFSSIPGGGGGGGGQIGGGGGGGGSAGTTGCSGNDKGAGGGGGGGSSYTGGVLNGVTNNGIWLGNGQVSISYTEPMPGAVTISGVSSLCLNDNVNLSCTSDPFATFYTWTVPSGLTFNSGQNTTTINVTGNTAGTYTVTAQAVNGTCSLSGPVASYTVTVNPLPTVTTNTSAITVCNGDMVTLFGQGATSYTWTSGISDNVPFAATATTTYTVTGMDVNGCMNTATVDVTVNPLPTVTTNTSAITVCNGDFVTLFGAGAATYSWTGGITDNVAFQPTVSDNYTVTGTDVNGCVNTASVAVTVNANPTVGANAVPSTTLCSGDTLTVFGTGAVSYVWSGGVTDGVPFVVSTATTTYTCTGTDANGCIGTFVGTLTINPLPTVTGTASDNSVCLNDAAVTLTGTPANGTWSGPGVTGSSFNPMTAGAGSQTATYTFTNTTTGCTNTASTVIVVSACVGVNEGNILESGISLYPNPTSGIFTINVNANVGDMTIEIVDIEGRVVYSSLEKNVQTGFTKQVSLVGLPNGAYLVNLTAGKEHAVHTVTLTK